MKYKKAIAEELLKRANEDECLMNKLLSTDKTIEDCFKYIKGEAKKQAVDNCAVLTDEEVYKLAQHFFLEDSITVENKSTKTNKQQEEDTEENTEDEETTSETKVVEKKQSKESKKEELKKKLYDGLDLFSI